MNLKKILMGYSDGFSVHILLFLLRICSGGFLLTHGIPKLKDLTDGGEIKFADPIGLGPETSLILTVFAEVFCSIFIILGLGTRFTAITLIIFMSVISFIVHGADPLTRKELPLFYLLIFITIFILGGRKYSLDNLIMSRLDQKIKK